MSYDPVTFPQMPLTGGGGVLSLDRRHFFLKTKTEENPEFMRLFQTVLRLLGSLCLRLLLGLTSKPSPSPDSILLQLPSLLDSPSFFHSLTNNLAPLVLSLSPSQALGMSEEAR